MVHNGPWFSIASEGAPMADHNPRHKTVVTEDMKAAAKALRLALRPFLAMRATMPAQYIDAFLRVVESEGLGVTDYANKAEVSKTVMTRYLLDLGERDRHGDEGFRLIDQQLDLRDRRIHRAYVTHKGAATMNAAMQALELFARAVRR